MGEKKLDPSFRPSRLDADETELWNDAMSAFLDNLQSDGGLDADDATTFLPETVLAGLKKVSALRTKLAEAKAEVERLKGARLKVVLTRAVCGIGCHAKPGEYPGGMNAHGAVWIILSDGKELGVKPGEFHFKGWEPTEALKPAESGEEKTHG